MLGACPARAQKPVRSASTEHLRGECRVEAIFAVDTETGCVIVLIAWLCQTTQCVVSLSQQARYVLCQVPQLHAHAVPGPSVRADTEDEDVSRPTLSCRIGQKVLGKHGIIAEAPGTVLPCNARSPLKTLLRVVGLVDDSEGEPHLRSDVLRSLEPMMAPLAARCGSIPQAPGSRVHEAAPRPVFMAHPACKRRNPDDPARPLHRGGSSPAASAAPLSAAGRSAASPASSGNSWEIENYVT